MTDAKPFINNATMREKAAILKNDVRVNTLQGRAIAELEMTERGRFARQANVTAAESAPVAFPAAPWTRTSVPDEPPLGVDINAHEPVGEHFEVRTRPTVGSSPQAVGDSASEEADAGRGVAEATSKPQSIGSATTSSHNQLFRRPLK